MNWRKFFEQHEFFSALTEEELSDLLSDAHSQALVIRAGDTVFSEGDLPEFVYVVAEGTVEVKLGRAATDEKRKIADLGPGEWFGEIGVLLKRPRTATVTVMEDCVLREINGRYFESLIGRHADMDATVRSKLCERLRQVSEEFLPTYLLQLAYALEGRFQSYEARQPDFDTLVQRRHAELPDAVVSDFHPAIHILWLEDADVTERVRRRELVDQAWTTLSG